MSDALSALADRYLAFVEAHQPVSATFLGLHSRDDALGDYSMEALRAERDALAVLLSDLDELVPPAADTRARHAGGMPCAGRGSLADAIDAEVLRIRLRGAIFGYDVLKSHELDPGLYVGSALYGCNQLLMRDFAPIEERARCFASRLEGVPAVLSDCRANVRRPPGVFAVVASEMARGGVAFLNEVVPRLAGELPAMESRLLSAAAAASEAFEGTARHLDGVSHQPTAPFFVGPEAYDWLLRENHLLDIDGIELLETGRRAVAETTRQVKEVAAEIDPSRDWREIVEELQKNHPDAGSLRDFYASEMARARDFVRDRGLVTIPAEESLDVVDTPSFLRTILPYAAYGPPGPFEERQRGFFYVTPVPSTAPAEEQERQLRGHWTNNIRVIALHEGYPGHHVQLVRANMVPSTARKLARSNLFIEGWALYCEEMMRDAGFFTDAPTRLCQLKATLWRAARIVVDVGLQRGEMSLDEAADYMVSTASLSRDKAVAEVKRYAGNPTQPSSYLLGKAAILSIRERYERAKGPAFDLLTFHDSLLDLGSVPPKLADIALASGV